IAIRVIPSALHELPCPCVVRNGGAIVEQFVSALDQEEITLGMRDPRNGKRFELSEVLSCELVGHAGVGIDLRPEVGREALEGPDRGVDEDRLRAETLGEVSRIETAERAADKGQVCAYEIDLRATLRTATPALHRPHRLSRTIVQLRKKVLRPRGLHELGDRVAELPALDRGRAAVEPVQIRDAQRRAWPCHWGSRASSLSCSPPKPPLLMIN